MTSCIFTTTILTQENLFKAPSPTTAIAYILLRQWPSARLSLLIRVRRSKLLPHLLRTIPNKSLLSSLIFVSAFSIPTTSSVPLQTPEDSRSSTTLFVSKSLQPKPPSMASAPVVPTSTPSPTLNHFFVATGHSAVFAPSVLTSTAPSFVPSTTPSTTAISRPARSSNSSSSSKQRLNRPSSPASSNFQSKLALPAKFVWIATKH
mmetsp:Transcript_24870/g.80444  ORF Transcript_24870/g.80444 Transcript_24870/m.80444 type:complete len:205 (-) Transcript_24870:608-1222(-)